MNRFYQQHIVLQWIESVTIAVICFFPALMIIDFGFTNPFYYLLFIFYIPLGQFGFTPIFKLTGVYTYYSAFLIGYLPNKIQIDLHSGGSFDFLFVMSKYKSGFEMKRKTLFFQLEGLLEIIKQIENELIPETVEIVGTSFFFNDRTSQKLGFTVKKPSFFYVLNLFVNFIDIFWMYSVVNRKVSFPRIWDAKKITISGQKLVSSKNEIKRLRDYIQ